MARVIQRQEWAAHPTLWSGEWEGGDANVTLILHESIEPGHGPRLHTHPYPETFVIEEGRAVFTVGEEEVEAGSGQIIVVPANTPHKFRTLGPMKSIHIHASPKFVTHWVE
ncbi:cupin domain-containing protein [Devosia sp. CN2-171]|jgi:mannose-6-phosphate isomerase-like protein (cupin superfamily)|uniref:cupin domain-containing protein n=1 Tax=Devosia sp. CN2-171 TaxID=3400909 RepID=UPI003BF8D3B1